MVSISHRSSKNTFGANRSTFEAKISSSKALAFCGPKHESHISSQTLNDESCMVACNGLYVDITDNFLLQKTVALQQTTTKGGRQLFFPSHLFKKIISGFRTSAEEHS